MKRYKKLRKQVSWLLFPAMILFTFAPNFSYAEGIRQGARGKKLENSTTKDRTPNSISNIHSTFSVQRSTFSVQRSAFNVQRSAFSVQHLP